VDAALLTTGMTTGTGSVGQLYIAYPYAYTVSSGTLNSTIPYPYAYEMEMRFFGDAAAPACVQEKKLGLKCFENLGIVN